MANLDTVRSALRNAVRACLITAANQAALLNDFPHGGQELGEVAFVDVGVQDSLYVPMSWGTGMPVDHGFGDGEVWTLALKLKATQDADGRALNYRVVATADGYFPAAGTIKSHLPGYRGPIRNSQSQACFLLLSAIDPTHDSVVFYNLVAGISPTPIRWSASEPAVGSLYFTAGQHATIGEVVAIDRLEHLRLS